MSEDREKELLEEIDRLKALIKCLEQKHKRKAVSVEFGIRKPEGLLHFVVTAPTSVDELAFGNMVAANVTLLLNGAAKMVPNSAEIIP